MNKNKMTSSRLLNIIPAIAMAVLMVIGIAIFAVSLWLALALA